MTMAADPGSSTITELYTDYLAPTLLLNPPETTTQTNYIKIIRSINSSNVVDIVPSVIAHIQGNEFKLERLELIQEVGRKLQEEDVLWELVKYGLLGATVTQILGIFSTDNSQSVQFELMSIICSLPESHLTEKLLSKLHSAALSSSPLIRRQSLMLVMKTLPVDKSLKFLLAYLDDDDPRVRTTANQSLTRAAADGCAVPYAVYSKIINNLSDSHHEVRLHSVQLLPYLVQQHRTQVIAVPGATSHTLTLTHHAFVELCLLMRDISTVVRTETARVLGLFTDVDPDFLKQTLDKKLKSYMKIVPEGSKTKQEYSAGRVWGGDAPIKTSTGEINIIDPAACGAFIHGMEDEYSVVRISTVHSLCLLSTSCPEFGAVSMTHLVDMLNDETQSVRLLAISSLQQISQNVHLHDDQLETVMSVLEESNVEIRQSLHKLLSSCKLNSRAAVRRVLKGLLDNLKKYPQDKNSVFRCVRGVGDNNPDYVALLAPEMLSKHPYLFQTEPNMDDISYIATMILVFNAAQHNSIILSLFHEYTSRHYMYIVSLLPELVPQLPQVHKISKEVSYSTDVSAITSTLNNLLKQFLKLCKTQNIPAMTNILKDIDKIRRTSPVSLPQAVYISRIIRLFLQLFTIRNVARKRLSNGNSRVTTKIQSLVYDLCVLEQLFSADDNLISMNSKLIKLYCLQFLKKYVPLSEVTDKDISAYRAHISDFIQTNQLKSPEQLNNSQYFNIFGYFLSLDFIVTSDVRLSLATILSPESNIDRVNEFPSHLAYSIHVEAEAEHIDPQQIAVKVLYPGDRQMICQPAIQCVLQNYYDANIFVGGHSWSAPGLISVSLVCSYDFPVHEQCFCRLQGSSKVWVDLCEAVKLKIHPQIPR